jgi:hypothetical protein
MDYLDLIHSLGSQSKVFNFFKNPVFWISGIQRSDEPESRITLKVFSSLEPN